MSKDQKIKPKKLIKTLLTQLLLLFLVITFAVWGIGDIVRGGNSQYIAKVGDRYITIGEFQNEIARIRDQSENQLPAELLNSPLFAEQIRNKLVQDVLVEEAAKAIGLAVSTQSIAAEIQRDPFFQDLTGNFDAEKFQTVLANQRLSEGVLMENIARRLRATALIQSYQLDQISDLPALANLQTFSDGETRDILIAHVTKRHIDTTITADETTLAEAYEIFNPLAPNMFVNVDPAKFSSPETREVSVVTISPSAIEKAAQQTVTQEAIDNYLANSASNDSKNAKQALTQQAKTALIQTVSDMLDDALAAGDDIAQAITNLPVKASLKTFRNVKRDTNKLSDKARESAFSLQQGESSLLQTDDSGTLFVVHVDSVTPFTAKRPFAEVKNTFKKLYVKDQELRAVRALAEKVYDEYRNAKNRAERQSVLRKYRISSNTLNDYGRTDYKRAGLPLPVYQRLFSASADAIILPQTHEITQQAGEQHYSFAHVLNINAPKPFKQPSEAAKSSVLSVMQNLLSEELVADFEKEVAIELYDMPVRSN